MTSAGSCVTGAGGDQCAPLRCGRCRRWSDGARAALWPSCGPKRAGTVSGVAPGSAYADVPYSRRRW